MFVYGITTQLEKCLLSYFDFADFGGRSGGAQFLGCQLQNLTFRIPGMYSQIISPSFTEEMKQKVLIVCVRISSFHSSFSD